MIDSLYFLHAFHYFSHSHFQNYVNSSERILELLGDKRLVKKKLAGLIQNILFIFYNKNFFYNTKLVCTIL